MRNNKTGITLDVETYWKLVNAKVKLKCKSWTEFADKLEKIIDVCVGEEKDGFSE